MLTGVSQANSRVFKEHISRARNHTTVRRMNPLANMICEITLIPNNHVTNSLDPLCRTQENLDLLHKIQVVIKHGSSHTSQDELCDYTWEVC